MKILKSIGSLIVIFTLIVFSSCEKDIGANKTVDVTFNVNNVTQTLSKKDGSTDTPDGNSGYSTPIPICSDDTPTHVKVTLKGPGLPVEGKTYTLDVIETLEDGTQTSVLKLDASITDDDFAITMFEVYTMWDHDEDPSNDDVEKLIWLSPTTESHYASIWGLHNAVTKTFTVDAFTKKKVDVDVICFEPYDYENFGFSWYDFNRIDIKQLCFFGDICTKFHAAFHARGAYVGQPGYVGFDFPVIFEIVITDDQGNEIARDNNLAWQGVGVPLCLEYPNYVDIPNEELTFTINMKMPYDGVDEYSETVYSDTFYAEEFDNTDLNDDLANIFGGDDGIFDFVVGNCSYPGNDASVELPAYIPVPDEVTYQYVKADGIAIYNPNYGAYITIKVMDGADPADNPMYQIVNNTIYGTFCGDLDNTFVWYRDYLADLYSTLEPDVIENLVLDDGNDYTAWKLKLINYMINHLDDLGITSAEVTQNIIWQVVEGNNQLGTQQILDIVTEIETRVTAYESSHGRPYEPTVGEYAMVLMVPYAYIDGAGAVIDFTPGAVQIQFIKIDP